MDSKIQKFNIVDISCKFNKTIKHIIMLIDNIVPNNTIIETIKRKVKVSIDANPLLLLQDGGEYLFQFRDYIKDNKLDELFLNTEHVLNSDQKNKFDDFTGEIISEENKNINKLLTILRDSWINMKDNEKKTIEKNIKILLSEYCKMLSLA